MTDQTHQLPPRPFVLLLGDALHRDFVDTVATLRADAQLTVAVGTRAAVRYVAEMGNAPELIAICHSRPGVVRESDVALLRRAAPLAGIVALAGSWCEGQSRTAPPLAGAWRLYWHEFTAWWQRQVELRAAGRCADWAQPLTCETVRSLPTGRPAAAVLQRGLVAVRATEWETADVLTGLLARAGYATVWQPPGRRAPLVRGAIAGVWEGGQLSQSEAEDLASFCERLGSATPVVALVDFPRCDTLVLARQAGAAAVLGKPWLDADLVFALRSACDHRTAGDAADDVARAA